MLESVTRDKDLYNVGNVGTYVSASDLVCVWNCRRDFRGGPLFDYLERGAEIE